MSGGYDDHGEEGARAEGEVSTGEEDVCTTVILGFGEVYAIDVHVN